MTAVFVDANVFLRFFTADDVGQHACAHRLFQRAAEGEIALMTGPPVLFEVAWTLRAAYGLAREEVLDVLARTASLPGLRLIDANLVEDALALARESSQEFADAYIAASARRAAATGVATFNQKHFERLGVPLHAF
jgi:predicted nucleic acid-binding protein